MKINEKPPGLTQAVDRFASQCVKCALCLPHCPTYKLTEDENESPRGRIALFQALAQEKLKQTSKVKKHLDQCLGCRACERVCPAHVEYGQLLTLGRALNSQLPSAESLPGEPFITRFLSWILTKPKLQRLLHTLLWGIEITGLRRVARYLKLTYLLGLQPLDDLLPNVVKPIHFQPRYEAIGQKRGRVMLFTGCITSWCDQETLAASIYVLRHLGMEVHVPANQTCCGAVALHSGDLSQAHQLALQNNQAFLQDRLDNQKEIDAIITTATGCSAVLQEYDHHFSLYSDSNNQTLSLFSSKIIDIVSFIQQCEWPRDLIPKPLPLQVILHTPCTLRNVLKTSSHAEQLLARIPQLAWKPFTSPDCCGAAGTYMLDHPSLAEPLVQNLLSELDDIQVNFIATSNIGCALHIHRQLKILHPAVTVGHPVTLIARALGF